ncbi:hypothetical protein C8R44DRAFT_736538 [Mycena epipterygia]|nr:hypothetical protein C8R44DRAFT_736538 [Mycena epipterygia]
MILTVPVPFHNSSYLPAEANGWIYAKQRESAAAQENKIEDIHGALSAALHACLPIHIWAGRSTRTLVARDCEHVEKFGGSVLVSVASNLVFWGIQEGEIQGACNSPSNFWLEILRNRLFLIHLAAVGAAVTLQLGFQRLPDRGCNYYKRFTPHTDHKQAIWASYLGRESQLVKLLTIIAFAAQKLVMMDRPSQALAPSTLANHMDGNRPVHGPTSQSTISAAAFHHCHVNSAPLPHQYAPIPLSRL